MTIDERLEALATHLEVLTHIHEELEKKTGGRLEMLLHVHEGFQKKMTSYAADVKDAIKRLANIAAVHDGTLDDHETRIKDLES